ncbi:hypothetical protein C1646_726079 [Rhizophagus diaphanus]|nr:hypothetical protein C1646_726079 [Rhizophagus diaphanus] [Rhizophagus sp. MUCL 43196]
MKGRYPILSDIAASERNCSTFRFIHSKLRNKLHEKQVEDITFIRKTTYYRGLG